MTTRALTRRALPAAAIVAVALSVIGTHSFAVSSTSPFAVSDRVTVNGSGESGTVAAVPDGSHIIVALDGVRANVQSFQPDQLSAETASPPPPPPPPPPPFPTRTASSLASFDQQSTLNGSLSEADGVTTARYGGGGSNGYARGLFAYDNPRIGEGQEIWMGARYYVPDGFAASAGYVSLLRRDNWPIYGTAANTCGVALWGGDDKLHVECDTYDDSWPTQKLIGGIALPEGRWFTIELHQVISSSSSGALSELYVDGRRVGVSNGANNLGGRPTDRVRFGIVAISPQSGGFSLRFRDAYVSSVRQPL